MGEKRKKKRETRVRVQGEGTHRSIGGRASLDIPVGAATLSPYADAYIAREKGKTYKGVPRAGVELSIPFKRGGGIESRGKTKGTMR